MSVVLITIITLGGLGSLAALILFAAAQKFKVFEDPRIDQVEEALPAANCGGCGFLVAGLLLRLWLKPMIFHHLTVRLEVQV